MKTVFPRVFPLGERAVLVEFDPKISEDTLEMVLQFKFLLEDHYGKVKVEIINTYCSLLINYLYTIENLYDEVLVVKGLLTTSKIAEIKQLQFFKIPVCYDEKFGVDLEVISDKNKVSKKEIITLHTAPIYTLYFIGFLPGFLYLGGLDSRLFISRKKNPRLEVQKGAVGIGEKQTGIYPKNSPGGWQIIGNSPVSFFDKNASPPSPFSAGDKIQFYPISKEEHREILDQVNRGDFQLKPENYNG